MIFFQQPVVFAPVLPRTMKLLSLLALSAFASVNALAMFDGPEVTESFSKTYAIAANGTVEISNLNGNVEVVAWDKNEVSLEAEKFSRDTDALKRIEIVVDSSSERLVIKTKHHKDEDHPWWSKERWSNYGGVRYKLKIPAALAAFRADVMNSNVTVDGIRSNVKINSMNGRITATGLTGDADLGTLNGAITASFSSVKSGQSIRLDTMNGSCRISVPRDLSATLRASSMNGSVSCELPLTLGKSGRHSLRGTIGQGGATINLHSMNGGLSVRTI